MELKGIVIFGGGSGCYVWPKERVVGTFRGLTRLSSNANSAVVRLPPAGGDT
jgi:hypothetical protein